MGSTHLKRVAGVAVTVALAAVNAPAQADEPRRLEVGSFGFEMRVDVAGDPVTAFDAFTRETLEWWDHHFSENPKKLYFETRPGGGFVEIFDDAGNGAWHATVVYADRGRMLRFVGPLGLAGRPIEMVHTLRFEPVEKGTRLSLDVRAVGEMDDNLGQVVRNVWEHFLVGRFEPYMRKKTGPGP